MSDPMELDLRRQAEHRADAKIGFKKHLLLYVAVNLAAAAINFMTSPSYLWFIWPLLGWGVGIVAHFAAVYVDDVGARERAIKREMERLRNRSI